MTSRASSSEIIAGFNPFVLCFSKTCSPVLGSIAIQSHLVEPLAGKLEEIKNLCLENGLSTVVYHSDMKQSDRISVLNDFQSDFYHTLIGCKALDEGFDVPDIDFGLIVSQTKTNRQRIQRLGRTIRKSRNKQKPVIYTLYTTESEYSNLYEEQFNNPEIEIEWKEVN